MLGILTLDTKFPRIPGDVGAPGTFPFAVRIATVAGADVTRVVHQPDDALLGRFIDAARALRDIGCLGVVTTCGFLVRWQRELADAVGIPVFTSALLHLPVLARCVAHNRRVGVVTYSVHDLNAPVLLAAGAAADTPVEGVDPEGYFARTIRDGAATLDRARMAADVVAAGARLCARHPDLGAIVLECANMPPYRDQLTARCAVPVYDAKQAIAWFHSGLPHPAYTRGDSW